MKQPINPIIMENSKDIQSTLSKTVRLDKNVVQDINNVAKEENRNFNNSVETLLKWALANRKVTINVNTENVSMA
jgi:hypothetical protein